MRVDVDSSGRYGWEGDSAAAVSEPEVSFTKMEPRAVANEQPREVKWGVVYHRIRYSGEHGRPCECEGCKAYLEAIHEKYWA